MWREERRKGWRTLVVVIVQSFGGETEILSFNELQHQKKEVRVVLIQDFMIYCR